jgi:DNA-binding response OmpR family regulator
MPNQLGKPVGALDDDDMLLILQQSLTKKRVLIIDRHAPARDSLRLMLGSLGVTAVHGAGNSAEVIRQVKANRFDIVLSDFILDDGRDGQQLLEELRYAHLIPLGTVYIIITGERSYSNVVAMAELVPDDYLVKPFTAEQLKGRLIRAIFRQYVLRHIHEKINHGALEEAIAACDRVIQKQPVYLFDAQRFKGELLQQLGRNEEAEAVYREVLSARDLPWARMGLAMVRREQGALDEAAALAEAVLVSAPQFLAAYDFLAAVKEARGQLAEAQQALQRAADASPHNTLRQRTVGDIALRNHDFLAAEKAFGKVIERSHGSSLQTVDDFANLSRTLIARGDPEAARRIAADMKRECRYDKQLELASLVVESLCLQSEGEADKAAPLLAQALAIQQRLGREMAQSGQHPSHRLVLDLAQACYGSGDDAAGHRLMRQLAAENNDDAHLLGHIHRVFEKTGRADAGQALLDAVQREIVELNNRGVMAARSGDLAGAVKMLMQAADQVPNLQFLVNAAKSIYTLIDRQGWDEALAQRAQVYLRMAQARDRKSAKLAAARNLAVIVSRKYGKLVEF